MRSFGRTESPLSRIRSLVFWARLAIRHRHGLDAQCFTRRPEIEASVARVVEQIFVSRGERVAKADHLKTIAVADEPDLHLAPARPVGRHLLKAREAGYLVVGSVNGLCPAA